MKEHSVSENTMRRKHVLHYCSHGDDDEPVPFSLRHVSKLLLPPLGMSGYNQSQIHHSGRIISPMDSTYRHWEALMVVMVAYSAWVYPFEMAFMDFSPRGGLFIVDIVVDLFFAFDIVLTFFIAYYDSGTRFLVSNPRKITARYLSTWFIMDVASTIPCEGICHLIRRKWLTCRSFTFLSMLRLWRLRKIKQFFTRLEKDIRFSYFWIRCVRLLCVTLFLVHCAGCLYYMIADRYPHQGRTWIGTVIPNFHDANVWVRYISAIYWAITTMTTVGYGDLHAVNTREMIFNITYMLLNLALIAYLVGNMTNLVVEGTHRTMEFRNSIQAASDFVTRNHLPARLKEQILAYMCFKYKVDCVNQQELMEQLPKSICRSIHWHLFLPLVQQVYLFKGVSDEMLLLLIKEIKAEYFPAGEDIISQNEPSENVYIIASGEVNIITCDVQGEKILDTLNSRDIFGEISIFCTVPQSFTYQTKTLCQLLRVKRAILLEAMHKKHADSIIIVNNFVQHSRELEYLNIDDVLWEGEGNHYSRTPKDLLTAAVTGDSVLLQDLLVAGVDSNIGDVKGRTPLADRDGNNPLWEAVSAKQSTIFMLLHHLMCLTNPSITGDLLGLAAKRNDLSTMNELLKHGLDVNSRNIRGWTPLQIALDENHSDMVNFLLMKGAHMEDDDSRAQTIGVQAVWETKSVHKRVVRQKSSMAVGDKCDRFCPRISIYSGHPLLEQTSPIAGKLIRMPKSMDELKHAAGELGVDLRTMIIMNERGAEIANTEVIRDNDKIFVADEADFVTANKESCNYSICR